MIKFLFIIPFCLLSLFAHAQDFDKSVTSQLKPNGQNLTLKEDFFIPHIPYTIICKIKNKSNETAFINASPGGAKEFTWNKIEVDRTKLKSFTNIIKIKPFGNSVFKVTGFELNGAETQIFFSVQNIGFKFNSAAIVDVSCGTLIE